MTQNWYDRYNQGSKIEPKYYITGVVRTRAWINVIEQGNPLLLSRTDLTGNSLEQKKTRIIHTEEMYTIQKNMHSINIINIYNQEIDMIKKYT